MSTWMVHLDFEEASSGKFWRARVEGGTLYVNHGKIGTNGQTQVKDLGSPEAAKKELDKLEREKRKKGYADAGAANDDEGEGKGKGEEEGDDDEEAEAPKPKRGAAAAVKAGLEARLAMQKGGRTIATHLALVGATVRMDAVETYASPEEARQAYYRLLATLAGEGHEES